MILCFDIGGSRIKAAVAESPESLRPLGSRVTPARDFEAFAACLAGFAEEAELPAGDPLAISIAGIVDPASGIARIANIPCLDGRRLAADLEQALLRKVLVANDADCFALAEATIGAGRGERVVFGAIIGTGVGGGIVIDGRIHAGAGGFAGEWGHGPVAATSVGTPPVALPRFACGCGLSGCLDAVGSARGLEKLHHALHGTSLSSESIIEAGSGGMQPPRNPSPLWSRFLQRRWR